MTVDGVKPSDVHTATSKELMRKANAVYDRRSNRDCRNPSPEESFVIGETPVNPGDLLRVIRYGGRRPRIEFRLFAVTPSGDCRPMRALGFTLSANALPQLAGLVAAALDLDLKEIPASRPAASQPVSSAGDQPSTALASVTGETR